MNVLAFDTCFGACSAAVLWRDSASSAMRIVWRYEEMATGHAERLMPMIGEVLLEGGLIGYFLAYAVGGYLMYAVLFAAIGAFCETPRDAQTLMGPIMMVLVVPLLVMQMALQTPDAPLVRIMSLVPFFTPFVMSARAPSEPPLIEVLGSIAGMFAFALLMVWLAGRAFRAGALSDVKLSWKAFATAIGRGR